MRARSRRSTATSGSIACSRRRGASRMDIFHDAPMYAGVRQMLGAFARQYIRPIAARHDADETMPWDLLRQASDMGMRQTSVIDNDSDRESSGERSSSAVPSTPRTSARVAVVAIEELAWG